MGIITVMHDKVYYIDLKQHYKVSWYFSFSFSVVIFFLGGGNKYLRTFVLKKLKNCIAIQNTCIQNILLTPLW